MTDKLFDEFVKSKLEHYDSGAPMHVWERIREKEKDDKKGFFFFKRFWLTGIVMLTLTGMAYLTWNSVTKNNEKDQQVTAANQKIKYNKTTSVQTIKETNSGNQQQQSSADLSVAENKITTSTGTLNTDKSNTDVEKNFTGSVAAHSSINTKQRTASAGENAALSNSKQKSDKADYTISQQQTTADQQKEYALSFTGMANYRNSLNNFRLGNITQSTNRPTCPTVNGPYRNDLYIEFYGSPDYTMRSFSNPSSLNNYIALRRSSEDNRNGFSTGIRIAKNIGEKMLIKAGVNYSQINERLRIVNEKEKQLTQIITIRTVIRAPGDTLFIRDTTYFEQSGTRYRTTYNRYRFIDIPLIFSYEFGNRELLSFSINAGPVFNISSFYRGEVLDTSLSPVKILTAKGNGANNWRSNIGVGIFASFAVYKHMNERLQIFGEPYLRYNFKPVTQNTNFVNQRYLITGMQLGIRYNLQSERQR